MHSRKLCRLSATMLYANRSSVKCNWREVKKSRQSAEVKCCRDSWKRFKVHWLTSISLLVPLGLFPLCTICTSIRTLTLLSSHFLYRNWVNKNKQLWKSSSMSTISSPFKDLWSFYRKFFMTHSRISSLSYSTLINNFNVTQISIRRHTLDIFQQIEGGILIGKIGKSFHTHSKPTSIIFESEQTEGKRRGMEDR